MSKSTEFLTELQKNISFEYLLQCENLGLPDDITGCNVDSTTIVHIGNILELIKGCRVDDLQAYINDDCGLTPNKNYTYRLRDKIASEIKHHNNFIKEVESND